MAQDTPSRHLDQFMLRLPDGMRDRIAEAAKANGRSMNAEIVERLNASLTPLGLFNFDQIAEHGWSMNLSLLKALGALAETEGFDLKEFVRNYERSIVDQYSKNPPALKTLQHQIELIKADVQLGETKKRA